MASKVQELQNECSKLQADYQAEKQQRKHCEPNVDISSISDKIKFGILKLIFL